MIAELGMLISTILEEYKRLVEKTATKCRKIEITFKRSKQFKRLEREGESMKTATLTAGQRSCNHKNNEKENSQLLSFLVAGAKHWFNADINLSGS